MGRPLNTARKEEIMQMSLKVFARSATWDTSLNELARQLKTSTRMLVHHFETREKLVRACKLRLKLKLAEVSLEDLKLGAPWSQQLLRSWRQSLASHSPELQRLQLIATLQASPKTQSKENALYIENLRELLPSRIKKFAEEIFTYQQGLTVAVMTGRSQDEALQEFKGYLRRIERELKV